MPNVTTNVTTGKPKVAGAVFRAPLGTTLPTDANSALNEAFTSLGFLSDEGLTNANSVESDTVKDWGGSTVLVLMTDRPDQFSFTALESLNPAVLKAYHGDENVTGTLETGITVTANLKDPGTYSWVFDMMMRDGAVKRIVLPSAMLAETGDIVYKGDEPVGYPITLAAMPDEQGNTHYEYIQRVSVSGGDTGGGT